MAYSIVTPYTTSSLSSSPSPSPTSLYELTKPFPGYGGTIVQSYNYQSEEGDIETGIIPSSSPSCRRNLMWEFNQVAEPKTPKQPITSSMKNIKEIRVRDVRARACLENLNNLKKNLMNVFDEEGF